MLWKRKPPDPEPESLAGAESHLEAVRLYTITETIDGWIDTGRQRLSDILNFEELLSVSGVPHPTDRDWFVVERERMLIVVPPPQVGDPAVRRHRVKRPVLALIAHYVVRGRVHLIAGIQLDPFLARSGQQFLPITDAWVTSTQRPEVDEHYPASLVNVRSTEHGVKLEVVE